ncbi:MAG: Tab2/Atab2 family RNA-binding protein [Pleurocapsa sp. MO_226.B13]|nr:Tab2/Atab2 family RNA-binding protein [Pleurocapsa sp. MO_226.B13]
MSIWQADFYYLPSQPGEPKQWELVVCDRFNSTPEKISYKVYSVQCHSEQANAQWLVQQIKQIAGDKLPDKIQVFRPQTLGLITAAAEKLGIEVEATRNTPTIKKVLTQRYKEKYPNYDPLKLEKPVPQPLPEDLWGDKWQIANINAGQLVDLFRDRPIPICRLPEAFYPINLGIASNTPIPGIVVYGGRKSMQLATWIEQQNPAYLNYIPTEIGKSGGFILETGLVDRWVFNTFESERAAEIARSYEQKKQAAKGLHFILIQPDDSGMTYTAFWLLTSSLDLSRDSQ